MNEKREKKRCLVCNGLKFVEGLGYMGKKCQTCQGIGYTLERGGFKEEGLPTPKRRGRPPKKKPEEAAAS